MPKTVQVKKAEIVIIATFIRLFNIKIVARRASGFFKSLIEKRKAFVLEAFIFSKSLLFKEKKATSEPETRPDNNTNKKINKKTKMKYG